MSCKFNSGRGAHTCDRCYAILCVGMIGMKPERIEYYKENCPRDSADHYLKMIDLYWLDKDQAMEAYRTDEQFGWVHEEEYCRECAAIVQLQIDKPLLTVKQVYES